MKLQSSESGVSDVYPRKYKNNLSPVFFAYFANFMEKEPFTQFMKLRSFEWLNCALTWTTSTRE